MTELHEAETRLEAWLQATESVMSGHSKQDIILHINSPALEHEETQAAFEDLNSLYKDAGKEPIHTIAEWIFPGWLYKKEGIEGVFDSYPEQLEAILENSPGYRWGTYFGRMITRKDPETGEVYNPLENLIEKMEKANSPDGNTFHSCYEMDLTETSVGIPLYDPSSDRNQRRGLPCLSHLSFKLFDGEVHLTALYRSHDYRFKVLGNLLGLARLQACVAREIDAEVGQLVVHSSRAFIADQSGKGDFKDLVETLSRKIDHHSLADFENT